jgi:hypothetical protein
MMTRQADEDVETSTADPLDAEGAALAACLEDRAAAQAVLTLLRAEDFSTDAREDVFRAFQLATTEGATDDVLVREELREKCSDERLDAALRFLAQLQTTAADPANAPHYVERVVAASRARRDAAIRERLHAAPPGPAQDAAIDELAALRQDVRGPARVHDVGAGDLLAMELPKREELVGDGIAHRKGVTVTAAPQKRGKTLVTLGLALALVRRIANPADDTLRCLGSPVLGAGPVLYLSSEGGPQLMQERIRLMEPHLSRADLNHLHIWCERPLPLLTNERDRAAVFARAKKLGAVLVVVDSFADFVNLEDENDAARMAAFFRGLRDATDDANVCSWLNHHANKSRDDDSPVTGGRGSSVIGAAADALVNMRRPERDRKPGQSEVHFETRWSKPLDARLVEIVPETLAVRFVSTIGLREDGQKSGPAGKVTAAAVRAALRPAGTWIAKDVLVGRLDVVDSTFRQHLPRLRESFAGELEEEGGTRGRPARYRLAPPIEGGAP